MIIRLRSHTHSFRCENRPLVCPAVGLPEYTPSGLSKMVIYTIKLFVYKNELKRKKLGTLNFYSYLCPQITKTTTEI